MTEDVFEPTVPCLMVHAGWSWPAHLHLMLLFATPRCPAPSPGTTTRLRLPAGRPRFVVLRLVRVRMHATAYYCEILSLLPARKSIDKAGKGKKGSSFHLQLSEQFP